MKLSFKLLAEYIGVGVILLTAAFFRLFRISEYMTFLGDEGRDVLVVKHMLEGDLTLLGPRASAGDFFLGPIYYYFMTPFLWLWQLDPVGPAVMVALFGIATVFLVYYIGKRFFGTCAGLFAASLYAVSPVIIAYSRSSWNPNPMPFFAIAILYLLYISLKDKKPKLLFVVGLLFGFAMQLHYLATFLGVIIIAYMGIVLFFLQNVRRIGAYIAPIWRIGVGFLIGFSPFIAFEIRNGFPNSKAIFAFVFQNTAQQSYSSGASFFQVIWDVFFRLFGRLLTRFPPPEQVSVSTDPTIAFWFYATIVIALCSIGAFLWQYRVYIRAKNTERLYQFALILLWFVIGVALFGLYKKPIYDYYFGFLFPLPFLLVGNALSALYSAKRFAIVAKVAAIGAFGYLMYYNYQGAPFHSEPNRQKEQVQLIAEFVLSKTKNEPFNFALLTPGNSDHGYRYFFEVAGQSPVTIENIQLDPERNSVTDQLLIICEDIRCQPLGNSLWEVAGFGRAEIIGEWDVSVVKVYKLGHYEGNATTSAELE